MRTLNVATCQFPVEAEIAHNLRWILRQLRTAARHGAHVAHFPECALSGYAGVDIPDTCSIDWTALTDATRTIMDAAREHGLWVLLGSTHRLSKGRKPHNSIYVINPQGQIVERYDKRFCTGAGGRQPTQDLAYYSPGNRACTVDIHGVRCGLLICYDYRFPELYRDYKRRGVEVIFQSFHNARSSVVADPRYNIWKTIVPASMACRAAENYFWISANNSTTRPSKWASFAVRPDGQIVGRLRLHRPGVLFTPMTIDAPHFDAPGPWREAAMNGRLHSGEWIPDERSHDVTCL